MGVGRWWRGGEGGWVVKEGGGAGGEECGPGGVEDEEAEGLSTCIRMSAAFAERREPAARRCVNDEDAVAEDEDEGEEDDAEEEE